MSIFLSLQALSYRLSNFSLRSQLPLRHVLTLLAARIVLVIRELRTFSRSGSGLHLRSFSRNDQGDSYRAPRLRAFRSVGLLFLVLFSRTLNLQNTLVASEQDVYNSRV